MVRNRSETPMTPGRGVVWDYDTGTWTTGTAAQCGFVVTWPSLHGGPSQPQGSTFLIAGVVAKKPIQPGAWGMVQNHGPVPLLYFSNAFGWGFWTTTGAMGKMVHLTYRTDSHRGIFEFKAWVNSIATYETAMNSWFAYGAMGVVVLQNHWFTTTDSALGTGYVSAYIRNL